MKKFSKSLTDLILNCQIKNAEGIQPHLLTATQQGTETLGAGTLGAEREI